MCKYTKKPCIITNDRSSNVSCKTLFRYRYISIEHWLTKKQLIASSHGFLHGEFTSIFEAAFMHMISIDGLASWHLGLGKIRMDRITSTKALVGAHRRPSHLTPTRVPWPSLCSLCSPCRLCGFRCAYPCHQAVYICMDPLKDFCTSFGVSHIRSCSVTGKKTAIPWDTAPYIPQGCQITC